MFQHNTLLKWSLAMTIVLCGQLTSSAQSAREKVIQKTNVTALKKLGQRYTKEATKAKAEALVQAKKNNWLIRKELSNGTILELHRLDDYGQPVYRVTHNANAAVTTGTDKVHPGGGLGLSLTGLGMTVGEWDGGAVRSTHQEFGSRVTQTDGATTISNHATHVAGTMVASGVNASAKGMAYEANLSAHDWTNDNAEMTTFAQNGGLVSNHSYGSISGWYYDSDDSEWYWYGNTTLSQTEDYKFGFYDYWTAQAWDEIAYNAPYYLIVKSAGNDRGDYHNGSHKVYDSNGNTVTSTTARDADGGTDGYDCVGPGGTAKNILTIGAIYDISGGWTSPTDVNMTTFSGWGPTDDGRIKPDLVGNGYSVYSTRSSSNTAYGNSNGTSMSSPNVSGSLLLIQQHYNNVNSSYMRSATLKGLAIHTANEAGSSEGPDYVHGWGVLNTAKAVQLISDNNAHILEQSLSNGGNYQKQIYNDGNTPIRATICWTDIKGAYNGTSLNNTTAKLVNDLDIRITDANGNTFMPYILNPNVPAAAATKGDNTLDNVEQVYISLPTAGNYTVQVNHKGTLSSAQDFSLIIEGDIPQNPSTGSLCAQSSNIISESPNDAISLVYDVARYNNTNAYTGRYYYDYTVGATTLTNASGYYNSFVSKYNSNGTPAWTVDIAGNNTILATKITVDNSGNYYVTGRYYGSLTVGAYSLNNTSGDAYGFVLKLNSNGVAQWLRSVSSGAGGEVIISDVSLDASQNLLLAGYYSSSANFFGSTTLTNTGTGRDAFVAKCTSAGNLSWASKYGSAADADAFFGISYANNKIHVGGYFFNSAQYGSYSFTASGGASDADAALIQLDNNGNVLWARQYSGTQLEYITDMACSPNGSVYAAMTFDSTITINSSTYVSGAGYDNYLLLNTNGSGTLQWTKHFAAGTDGPNCVAINADDNYVFVGSNLNSNLILNGITYNNSGDFALSIFEAGTGTELATEIQGGTTGEEYIMGMDLSGNTLALGGYYLTAADIFGTTFTTSQQTAMWGAEYTVSPPPSLSIGQDVTIGCQGSTQLNASTSASTYTWFPTTGLSSTNTLTPTANPTATTTYKLSTVDACGNVIEDSLTVTVDILQGFSVTTNGMQTSTCTNPAQLQATTTGTGNLTYAWSPTIGLSDPTIANPIANPITTTTYRVNVTNVCGGIVGANALVVANNPQPSLSVSNDTTITCANNSVQLLATTAGVAPFTYSWSNASSLSAANLSNPVATPGSTTTYQVTATDACGRNSVASVTIDVNTVAPSLNLNSIHTITCGSSTTLNSNASGTGPFIYTWSPANTTLSDATVANPTASPLSTTTYNVTATDACGVSTNASTIVNVNAITSPTINQNGTLLSTASAANTYQWFLNGVAISGATSASFSPVSSGDYTVEITDNNGCTAVSAPYNYTITSIDQVNTSSGLVLYPNPNDGHFTIEVPMLETNLEMVIYNNLGQLVYQGSLNQNQQTIELGNIPAGMYFLRVATEGTIRYNKVFEVK